MKAAPDQPRVRWPCGPDRARRAGGCAAILVLLAGASCRPTPAETDPPRGLDAADGASRAAREARRARAAWRPAQPVEVLEVDPRELPALFGDRIPPPSDAVLAHARRFETDDTYWPTETAAERAEATLAELVAALLGQGLPADALAEGFRAEVRVGPAATVFEDGGLRVTRRSRAEPEACELAFQALAGELRAALEGVPAGGVSVEVLVTSIDRERDPRTSASCVLAARAAPAPRQVSLALEADWRTQDDGRLLLERLAVTELEAVRAEGLLFAELTPWVLGAESYYQSEILRGVDDYAMRIDRQGGSAFQGMQGLAVGDVNGDGLEDVYLCQQVGLPNRLLIKHPDGSASDRAAEAKVRFLDVTRAALIVDLDDDGDRDLVLAVAESLVVAYNDGRGVFEEQLVLSAGGSEQIYNLSAADADGDGDLDLYAGRYALEGIMHGVPTPYHDAANGSANTYWRNEGGRRFVDATQESGLGANNTRFTLASVWEDFDADGDLDLYVVNDFGRNNLYRNDGRGNFEDVAEAAGALDIGAGMGAAVADYDLDGHFDLFVTNMYSAPGLRITAQAERFMDGRHPQVRAWYEKHARGNTLLRGRGDGSFEDQTEQARVAVGRWGWGGVFADFDNDGSEDLYVPCGHATRRGAAQDLEAFFWHRVISSSPPDATPKDDYAAAFSAVHRMVMYEDYSWNGNERNLAYLNTGGGRFADVSAVSGLDWPDDSRAAALVDWDEDGRVDVLLKSRNAPRLRILHNRAGATSHWLAFELVGSVCNRDAVGALVEVTVEDGSGPRVLKRRVRAGDGYLAQSSLRPHFGLGRAEGAIVSVLWPGGAREDFGWVEADRRWRLVQGAGRAGPLEARVDAARLAALEPRESAWDPSPVTRVPLAARLPLAPFAIPGFEQPGRRVSDLAGTPAMVVLFTASHAGGAAALSGLAARAADLGARGLRVVPLSTDQGPQLAEARRLAERYGLAAAAGYADGRVLEAFEIVLLEVLGYFRALPSPVAFLLDPAGNLVVAYVGPPRAEDVLADLDAMLAYEPGALGTGRFGGGRWLVRRGRDFAGLAQVLSARGHAEIGRFFAALGR